MSDALPFFLVLIASLAFAGAAAAQRVAYFDGQVLSAVDLADAPLAKAELACSEAERPSYFDGRFLTAQDFTDEQEYAPGSAAASDLRATLDAVARLRASLAALVGVVEGWTQPECPKLVEWVDAAGAVHAEWLTREETAALLEAQGFELAAQSYLAQQRVHLLVGGE
jgi:hypothetical protein